jgi:hypothetical protein
MVVVSRGSSWRAMETIPDAPRALKWRAREFLFEREIDHTSTRQSKESPSAQSELRGNFG